MAQALPQDSTARKRSISLGRTRARFRRLDLESGNQEDKVQARLDRKLLVPIVAGDDEAAKLRRRGVVGMTFKLGTKLENLCALERAVERAHSSAWSTPSRTVTLLPSPRERGTSPVDRAGKCKWLAARPR